MADLAAVTQRRALSHKRSGDHRTRGVGLGMPPVSYARHRFPPAIIQHAVWLYLRFALRVRLRRSITAS